MDVRLPDGTIITNVPDGITKAQLDAKLHANGYDLSKLSSPPDEAPPKRPGFWGSWADSASTLGLTDELAAYKANETAENRKKLLDAANNVDPATGKPKYQGIGLGEGKNWGEHWESIKELLGGSLGQMTAPIAAGWAATLPFGEAAVAEAATGVGAPAVLPTIGAGLIAGTGAALGVGSAQYTIQNAVRQAAEQQKAVEAGQAPAPLSLTKAALAAVPQAVLDQAELFLFGPLARAMPFVKNLVTPAGKATEATVAKIIEAAEKGTLKTFAGGITKGIVEGVAFEIPTEIAQQALERWQAGLSLSDEEAVGEYKQAAIGALVLAPILGAPSGAIGALKKRADARKKLPGGGEKPPGNDEQNPELTGDVGFDAAYARFRAKGFPPEESYAGAVADQGRDPRKKEAASGREGTPAGGTKPSVSVPNGETSSGQPAPGAAGAEREALGDTGEDAGGAGVGTANVPGSLDEENDIGAREEARIKEDALWEQYTQGRFDRGEKPNTPPASGLTEEAEELVKAAESGAPAFFTNNLIRILTEHGVAWQDKTPAAAIEELKAKGAAAGEENDIGAREEARIKEDALWEQYQEAKRGEEQRRAEASDLETMWEEEQRRAEYAPGLGRIDVPPITATPQETPIRTLQAELERGSSEQAKRRKLLADPQALTEYAAQRGVSPEELQTLLQTNYDANVPRLAGIAAHINSQEGVTQAATERTRAAGLGWKELPVSAQDTAGAPIVPSVTDLLDHLGVGKQAAIRKRLKDAAPDAPEVKAELAAYAKNPAVPQKIRAAVADWLGLTPAQQVGTREVGEPSALEAEPTGTGAAEEVPFGGAPAVTDAPTPGAIPPALTPDAMDLLAKVDAGGVPGFMSNNLRKIAAENGVAVTSNMTPKDVVNALRAREAAPKTEVAPEDTQTAAAPEGPRAYIAPTDLFGFPQTDTQAAPKAKQTTTAAASVEEAKTISGEELPLFKHATENPNVEGQLPYDDRLPEQQSRLIKGDTAEAQRIKAEHDAATQAEAAAKDAEAKKEERISNFTEWLSKWAANSPKFASVKDAIQPYLRAAARDIVENNAEPIDALLKAIPAKYKAQRAAVRESFKAKTAPESKQETQAAPEPKQEKQAAPEVKPTEAAPEAKPTTTKKQAEYGAQHAADLGGEVAYQDGDIGLVRGYSVLNGQPVYAPFKGQHRGRVDVDTFSGKLFSPEELTKLRAAKAALETAAAEKHASNPAISFDQDGLALSNDIPAQLAGVITAWKKLLLPGVKVYVTTLEAARANKNNFTGGWRAVGSAGLDANEKGSTRYISSEGGHYIVFSGSTKPTAQLEIIAHELGHVHQKEAFNKAPVATKAALMAEHHNWLVSQKDKTARELVDALRAKTTGRATAVDPTAAAADLKPYWKSFSEWYADQTSRWAVSSQTPVSVVEKFFARLGQALRNFYATVRGQKYLPTETFAKYIEAATKNVVLPSEGPISEESSAAKGAATAASDANAHIDVVEHKIAVGESAQAVGGALGESMKAHDPKAFAPILRAYMDSINTRSLKYFLPTMPSSTLLDWIGKQLPSLLTADEAQQKLSAYRTNVKAGFAKIHKRLGNFVNTHGMATIGKLMHASRLLNKSTMDHASLADALKNDPEIKHYEQILANPNTSHSILGEVKQELAWTQADWKYLYGLHDALAAQKGGIEMYKEVRQFYRDLDTMQRVAEKKYIAAIKGLTDESKKALSDKHTSMYDGDTTGATDWRYKHAKLAEYFPFMRFGEYSLRVGSGVNREYHKFYTAFQRNLFHEKRAKELGVSVDDNEVFERSDNITEELKNAFKGLPRESAILREVMEIADRAAEADGTLDVDKLKEDLGQMFLSTLPASSIRKRAMHSENITGFSGDIMAVFEASANSYATQLAKLTYANDIRAAIGGARESAKVGARDTERLNAYINEIDQRAEAVINPPKGSPIVSWFNRAAFFYYLTSAATAMTQGSSLPIRVFPSLASRYGYADAAKMMMKYAQVWNSVGRSEKQPDGSIHHVWPTMGLGSIVRSNPLLARAYEALKDYAIFSVTPTTALTSEGGTVPKHMRTLFDVTTGMFNAAEQLTREASALMHFELEFKKHGNFDEAVKAAVKHTKNALGDYSEFERPTIMKGPLARTIFLFKMYAVNTTKFFLTNANRAFIQAGLTKEERSQARHELAGVLLMGGVFHGLLGMPAYGAIAATINLLLENFEDDDDKKRRRLVNPILADDADARFRFQWLPQHFGKVTVPGTNGAQVDLGSMLERGPLSAATGINFGTRTSFDHLWFRQPMPSTTWSEFAQNMFAANFGPSVSLGAGIVGAADDFNNGKFEAGLEKLLPAIGRGPVVAYRLATSGAETKGGDTMIPEGQIADHVLAGQILGWQPTELAILNERRGKAYAAKTRLNAEKSMALRRLNEAMDALYKGKGSKEDVAAAMARVKAFNARYPGEEYAIDDDTMDKSYEAYDRLRGIMVLGVPVEDKELQNYLNWLIAGKPEKPTK